MAAIAPMGRSYGLSSMVRIISSANTGVCSMMAERSSSSPIS